jgi:hypothetical protein
MNPWLEQEGHWQDFHTKFLVALSERLVPRVGPNYYVLLEYHIYVHQEPEERVRLLRGDLLVTGSATSSGGAHGTAVMEAPAEVEHPAPDVEPVRVLYLEIRHAAFGDLVTVVEMLSPSNKQGENRRDYLTKRGQLLASRTHLVEVDLLRGGEPMPDADRPLCDYSVMVSRAENRPRAGFWPVMLREPLPTIPIPLRHGDGNVRVDLQEALQHVYDASGYENFIYRGSPSPPLSPEDAAWAKPLLPASRR